MNKFQYNKTVSTFAQPLYTYAVKWSGIDADAKDLVQDVFEKLWNNRKTVEPKKTKSFLFTCMHNALVNYSKKIKNGSVEDIVVVDPVVFQPNLALRDVIEKSLLVLSPVQKSILILRDAQGYPYEEIGTMLDLNPSQVKVYLFRARKKIKEQLINLDVQVA